MDIDHDWPASAGELALREPRHARAVLSGVALAVFFIAVAVLVICRTDHRATLQGAPASQGVESYFLASLGLLAVAFMTLCAVYATARGYITAREQREQALRDATHRAESANRQKSELLSWASREMRSPLTAILGQCDQSPGESEIVRRSANQILNILDTLLDPEKLSVKPAAERSENTANTDSPQPIVQGPLQGRVLLVEDSNDNRPVIEYYLNQAGVEVTTAGDGKAAYTEALWAVACGTPFDLILMDTRMPILDGCATTILLRNCKYMGAIVALSANATEEDRDRCLTAGHNGFLAKPIVPSQLGGVLVRYLRRADATTADAFNALTAVAQKPHFMKLVDSFKQELPHRIEAIEQAASAGETQKISELAHQLKGTAGCYGLAALSAAAGAIQSAADHFERSSDVQAPIAALRELWSNELKSVAA